jgi:signal transduction histidine kinase/CheY-like chemotaxis protein
MDKWLLESDEIGSKIVAVIQGISNKRGQAFFESIVQHLAKVIGADYTFIGRLGPDHSSATTMALCKGSQLIDNFSYDLQHTPCENVAGDRTCIYPHGICEQFPHDQLLIDMGIEGYIGSPLYASNGEILGLIVALYEKPIADARPVASVFELFAGRVAAEIENAEKHKALQSALDELDSYKRDLEAKVKERTRELELQKQKAEQADAAKMSFLSAMSHEIRTPMNGVLGMADLLSQGGLSEEQQKYLHALTQSGDTMMRVINDILDYTKIAAGELELEEVNFHLSGWLVMVVAPFQTHSRNDVQVRIDLDAALPASLRTDITRLHQVLCNLLSNALKFTHHGQVDLTVGLKEQVGALFYVEFKVTDTGIGIAEEQLKSVFEPFSQAEVSTTRKYGGSGLGLSISKNIVDRLGGELVVQSALDEGSCFSFVIPMRLANAHAEASSGGKYVSRYPDLKLLLVEDNKINQMVARGQLTKLGVSVDVLNDGDEAVEVLCRPEHGYDLVLMDCEMPRLNGFEASQQIRQWESEQQQLRVPIYALTAHVLAENTQRCLQSGMDGKLTKPVKLSDYPPIFDQVIGCA